MEKSQLEMNVTNSNKAAKRMSQNVEELQWRIRNNFDLPVEVFPIPNNQTPQPLESQSRKKSFFSVSPEMLDATSTDEKIRDKFVEEGATSDFSPSSDGVAEFVLEEDPEGEEAEYLHNSDLDGIDGDSLDEGLGDISSDGETAESPLPYINNLDNQKMYNNNISDQAIIICAKSPDKNIPHLENDSSSSCPIMSPQKERRPSRISFETPL